jgi:hypothetical protein
MNGRIHWCASFSCTARNQVDQAGGGHRFSSVTFIRKALKYRRQEVKAEVVAAIFRSQFGNPINDLLGMEDRVGRAVRARKDVLATRTMEFGDIKRLVHNRLGKFQSFLLCEATGE